MKQVNYFDFIQSCGRLLNGSSNNKLISLRGTNGSGKSTIPFSFINSDEDTFEITYEVEGKPKVMATVCPNHKWLFLGSYKTKCGGLDSYRTTEQTKDSLRMLWYLPYNVLLEGILASTVFSTYSDLFKELNKDNSRDVTIASLIPPLETCFDRISMRNGGKEIKKEQVSRKYEIVKRNQEKFKKEGFKCLQLDNSGIKLEDTRKWFLDSLGSTTVESTTEHNNSPEVTTKNASKLLDEVFLPDKSDIEGYPWYKYYKEPDDTVKINKEYFDRYWNFITERMNIYWKRVVLQQPAPWTEDSILRNYKFTNVLRDMDRLSIYARKHILSKMDEPCDDLEKRKKEVIFNTMIFRLFVKIETWECIGFLYLDTFDEQWELACERLRARRKSGEPIFTSAYFVYTLLPASPSPDNHDKTENAINLIRNFWYPKLDEIYDVVTTSDMGTMIDYLSTEISCVGRFNAYECACDFGMITRYCKNHIVSWDNDSYTNVGPGAERGINWVFEDKGNLSDFECIIYLRAIWKHELQRLGTYEQFVNQLPKEMNKDIDLRVIEHCLCETQKYNKALTETGRPREKFTPQTKNLDELKC